MGTLGATFIAALGFILSSIAAAPAQTPFACDATAPDNRLEVVAPMFGADPVWMVDDLTWGDDKPRKTIWVLSRKATGSLTVSGRRLDSSGAARFRAEADGPTSDVLKVPDPWHGSMIPGGASREVMAAYTFVHGDVAYAAPGCWELNATLGDARVRIVRDLRPRSSRPAEPTLVAFHVSNPPPCRLSLPW